MSASSNKFGHLFSWSSFGESHGPAMGVVIDGCPAGIDYNESLLFDNLQRRRPGQMGKVVSSRKEKDSPQILSGIFNNKTLGTPIGVMVPNQGQRSEDYDEIKTKKRLGHADDLWEQKFDHYDHRGGGRASARETLNWVIAGSFAQMFCLSVKKNITVQAKLKTVGTLEVHSENDPALISLLTEAREQGESYGGTVELIIKEVPLAIGEPIFKKMKSEMASAFMAINACNAVEFGAGFAISQLRGTEVHTVANHGVYGGIRGGLTTGEPIRFRLGFKPTSSIAEVAKLGRHDPCVVLRALPVVEAMAWNVLADQILMKRLNKI